MALVRITIFMTALLSGPFSVVAQSAVESDRKPAIVRRHRDGAEDSSMVHLSASGELIHMEKGSHKTKPHELFSDQQESTEADFCNEAYVLGNKDTNNCSDPSLHSLILRQKLCEDAAAEAAGQTGTADARFQLDYDHIDKYPIGCFKEADSNVFFFNPDGDWPHKQAVGGGVPVCSRVRFQNGTTDANDGCPAGYGNILDIETCRAAAKCSGYCTHTDLFHVGIPGPTDDPQIHTDPRPSWASQYNSRPQGCFINHEDGCVYYNEPQGCTDHGCPMPTSPSGIPMCNISIWTS